MTKIYGKRWRTIRDINDGGQAQVYLVHDDQYQYPDCALKRIRNPKRHERFRNEVEAVKRLDHPNIIKLYDHSALDVDGASTEKQYLVMPFAKGCDLSDVVERYKGSLDSVLIVAKQIAEGLRAAHAQQVVHRDIKPENILFTGAGHDLWISDFGICLIQDVDRTTPSDEVVGPRAYMAPELEDGGRLDVAPAADVYSLGKVIYYMLSGGVCVPRERLNEGRYSAIFNNGGRYGLLQILLSQMICGIEKRIPDMATVIQRMNAVEDWEKQAELPPVTDKARSAIERLKAKEFNVQSIHDQNDAARVQEAENLTAVQASVFEWMQRELDKMVALLQTPGMVEVAAGEASFEKNPHGPMQYGKSYLRPLKAYELRVIIKSQGNRVHRLRLYFAQKVRAIVTFVDNPQRLEARDLDLVFVPMYVSGFHQQLTEVRLFLNRPGKVEALSTQFFGPQITLSADFKMSEWPKAKDRLQETLNAAVELFAEVIQQANLKIS